MNRGNDFIVRLMVTVIGLFLPLFVGTLVLAGEIRIAWEPNTESDLAGYKVYYGKSERTGEDPKICGLCGYSDVIPIGKETTYTITDLTEGETYYIAVTAYDRDGNESGYSNQVYGKPYGFLHGEWVLTLSRGDKGGMVVRFDDEEDAFEGYGISENLDFFRIQGTYAYGDGDSALNGTYRTYDFYPPWTPLNSGNLHGSFSRNRNSMTLSLEKEEASIPAVGGKITENHDGPMGPLPENWLAKLSGKLRATLDPLGFKPYPIDGNEGAYLFVFSEPGIVADVGSITGLINLDGVFLLIPSNKVYGVFEISGDQSELGFFSGTVSRNKSRFTFTLKSESGNRYIFTGIRKEPED